MDNQVKLDDLRMVLGAIKTVRAEWLATVEAKILEILTDHPRIDPIEARNRALTHPDVHAKYMPLISLYGVIGGDIEAYQAAVDSVVRPDAPVIPLRKKRIA